MGVLQSAGALLGRVLLSIIFISASIQKWIDWQGTFQYFNQALTDRLAISVGAGFVQDVVEWSMAHAFELLLLGSLFEFVGGILIFLGVWVRLGALLLILFLIPTTLLFHNFWELQEPDRQLQMTNFMKNVSIFGGLFLVLSLGKGGKRCSKDHDKKAAAVPQK